MTAVTTRYVVSMLVCGGFTNFHHGPSRSYLACAHFISIYVIFVSYFCFFPFLFRSTLVISIIISLVHVLIVNTINCKNKTN